MPAPTKVEQLLDQIGKMEEHLNAMEIIPAPSLYRTSVLLALWSKALTVSLAVCALIKADCPIEAFGLSRTLIEFYFTTRFIGNRNTEERAKTFVDFGKRVQKEWQTLAKKYFPQPPAGNWSNERRGNGALFIVTSYLCKMVVVVYRAINEDQPESVKELFDLMSTFIPENTL